MHSAPIISQKPTTLYEKKEMSISKVHSVDAGLSDPDLDLLLDVPPLRSNKSMSTTADSSDMQEQEHLQHHKSRDFRGGKRCEWQKKGGESEPKGEVVIDAKPAGVVAPAAMAEME